MGNRSRAKRNMKRKSPVNSIRPSIAWWTGFSAVLVPQISTINYFGNYTELHRTTPILKLARRFQSAFPEDSPNLAVHENWSLNSQPSTISATPNYTDLHRKKPQEWNRITATYPTL
jgi:hypothetical protein